MKRNKLIRILLAVIVISAVAAGCTKNRQMYEQGNYEAVNSVVMSYQSLYDLVKFSDNMATSPAASATAIPLTYSADTANGVVTLHLNFGITNTASSDKRSRSGKVDVQFTLPYSTLNSPVEINCINYNINGYKFTGALTYTITSASGSHKIISLVSANMQAVSAGYSFTLTGNLVLNSTNFVTDFVKGSLKADGSPISFNAATNDSIEMLSATQCFEKGKTTMTEGDFNSVINYGDGQKDSLATATSETIRYIINLKRL